MSAAAHQERTEHDSKQVIMLHIVADSPIRYPLKIIFTLLAALFVAPSLPPMLGQGPQRPRKKKRRGNPKKQAKELELLQRCATQYWEGVRWNDTERSASFIEDSNDRMEFQQWLEDQIEGQKIMESTVIRVDVEPVPDKKSPITSTAYLSIAMKGYTMPEQILKKEIVQQEWYLNANGWWLKWESPTVKAREAARAAETRVTEPDQ